jgi:hypothetical protein
LSCARQSRCRQTITRWYFVQRDAAIRVARVGRRRRCSASPRQLDPVGDAAVGIRAAARRVLFLGIVPATQTRTRAPDARASRPRVTHASHLTGGAHDRGEVR